MKASASKLELLERCPSAGALSATWFESTPDQIAGTGRHRFMQRAAELGRDAALVEIPADAPWRAQCEALVLDGKNMVYFDDDHLTDYGAQLAAPRFEAIISDLVPVEPSTP